VDSACCLHVLKGTEAAYEVAGWSRFKLCGVVNKWMPAEDMPTAFTPNGDGMNDCFEIPPKLQLFPNELTIFNRAGAVMYSKKNYNDELCNGLPDGTYFYTYTYTDVDGKERKIFNTIWVRGGNR